jgi:predicted peptidase
MMRETGFLNRPGYVVYLPREYDGSRAWPVILFLHGSGERGPDPMRATQIGVAAAIRHDSALVPAIAVFPIAPEETRWLDEPADAAMRALDHAVHEFRGDPHRIYITGLSMGGYGAIHLGLAHPGRFAAMVVVCGGLLPHPTTTAVRQSPLTMQAADPYAFTAQSLKHVPLWLFHGADDPVIPVDESRHLNEQFRAAGAEVHYTEYAGVGHNAWDKAYADTAMWTWLFARNLTASAAGVDVASVAATETPANDHRDRHR